MKEFSENEIVNLSIAINLSGSVRLIQADYKFIGQTDSNDAYFAYTKNFKLNPDDVYLLPEKVKLKDLSNKFKGNFEDIKFLNKMLFVAFTPEDALNALMRYEEAKLHILRTEIIRLQTLENSVKSTIEDSKNILENHKEAQKKTTEIKVEKNSEMSETQKKCLWVIEKLIKQVDSEEVKTVMFNSNRYSEFSESDVLYVMKYLENRGYEINIKFLNESFIFIISWKEKK